MKTELEIQDIEAIADKLLDKLKPIHQKRQELIKDKTKIRKILREGSDKAIFVAAKTIKETREVMHL